MAGQNTFEILLLNDANMIGNKNGNAKCLDTKKNKIPCRESKVQNYKLPIWHF